MVGLSRNGGAGKGAKNTLSNPQRAAFHVTMTKLVLLHKADSIHDDEPDVVYDFPKAYLKLMSEAVRDCGF